MHHRVIKRLCFFTFTLFFILQFVTAQIKGHLIKEESGLKKSYPLPSSYVFRKQKLEIQKFLAKHPEAFESKALRKTAIWPFTVGYAKAWYADDLTTSPITRYQVQSTCRAVGTNCYIFVEDASWGTRVNQAIVDSVRIYFDEKTPANPSQGIYQMNVDAFGNPPDVDGDPRIIILLLDIRDGYSSSGGYVVGYFYAFNEMNPNIPQYNTSNFAEMYFLDTNPLDLMLGAGLELGLSTTAHEFQHMINFNYCRDRINFMDEGCSLIAEVHCGYPIFNQDEFIYEPNHYLFDWRSDDINSVLRDYARAARFFVYLRDQFGMGLFKHMVASPLTDESSIDAALKAIGSLFTFQYLIPYWCIANILNDRTVDTLYGYKYPNLPSVQGRTYYQPNIALTIDTVQNYAAQYLSLKAGREIRASFSPNSNKLVLKAIEVGPTSSRVVDVPANADFTEPLFGTTYQEIHFAVINTDRYVPASYFYQLSGTATAVEERWDQLEPMGLLSGSVNDTVCVTFDGFPGARLDSLRIAVRNSGSATGGVYLYTGSPRPTPLGARLAYPITVSSDYTTPIINPGSTFPYPVPYPNWRTIDLRSFDLVIDRPFAVAFALGSQPAVPGFMVTKYPGSIPFHSYTYLSSQSPPNWYYLSGNTAGDSIFIYLMRAYLSYDSTRVLPITKCELSQNFPNPFRSTTTIRYQLPKTSYVTLTIYDVLGRVVGIPLRGYRNAGIRDEVIDLGNLSNGVYFYRIKTDNFLETKKMVLLKE